jgi:hypothetical protein
VIKRHDAVQIPVFPAQVIAHDRGGRGLGLFWAVVIGVHKRLGEKEPSLPNFLCRFNEKSILAFWR